MIDIIYAVSPKKAYRFLIIIDTLADNRQVKMDWKEAGRRKARMVDIDRVNNSGIRVKRYFFTSFLSAEALAMSERSNGVEVSQEIINKLNELAK